MDYWGVHLKRLSYLFNSQSMAAVAVEAKGPAELFIWAHSAQISTLKKKHVLIKATCTRIKIYVNSINWSQIDRKFRRAKNYPVTDRIITVFNLS